MIDRLSLNPGEDLYLMANVHPKHSGLPFVIYVSESQGCLGPNIKIAAGRSAPPFVASVSVTPEVRVVAGELDAASLKLISHWIDLNRAVILSYWEDEISTADMLVSLERLP